MFKKKPNVKPLAPLRSSDRRKTADHIIATLGLEVPASSDAVPDEKAAATAGLTTLRNALLPENALSGRFDTTHGPDLKRVSGTIYVAAYAGEEQRVLWIKLEDKMYPTVYTLWHNPRILPLLHTPAFVVEKLQGGADLMTPGLQNGPPFPQKAKKGAVVAIASLESPTVPVVVGVCEIDVSALDRVQGSKGHAVRSVHWSGDELWAWSTTGKPGAAPPKELEGWSSEEDIVEDLAQDIETTHLNEEGTQGGVPVATEEIPAEALDGDVDPEEENVAHEDDRELTTKEVDEAFRKAFEYGVWQHKQSNPSAPNYGLDFPLSQSFVMANLVQPFLPAFSPRQSSSLHIKKSSHKNIKKFIKSLDKDKLVKCKDRDGNEVVILDVDFEDQKIVSFKPYRLPKKETSAGTSLGRGERATTAALPSEGSDPSLGQKLKKVDLYKAKERLSPLFGPSGSDHRAFYTAAELRPIVTAYIEAEKLVSPANKRLVSLNPIIANAVFDGSARIDKEVLAKGSVPRDALIDRVISNCAAYHAILRNDENLASVKPKAGSAPKVTITLETRTGNKMVTKTSGVEAYGIRAETLADELRKACASSTSVERAQGSSPKNPIMEVMVQGPQKDVIFKALEKRGINRNWVEVVDKTKKKK
ncbi:hypothetical protein K490DRAFT_68868 [Saccharata proteae CBS 121410]|uniref:SUI1 domain-containing protein n=1 Tax=Saccharata proteae CBS 121410 TaxID=1314787 RepID=A0A9P4LUQ8_9PEZI|nr:hypothetical protein K490DRAFT_68868 [Saccharata proteae CBS 121410]